MKRYLLDSNAVTALVGRRAPLVDRVRAVRRQGARIGTCEPVVAELLAGLHYGTNLDENLARLRRGLAGLNCWPLDRRASETYGRLWAELRRSGRPIQTVDLMLAAIALSLANCTVVTTDSDLRAVPGLTVENWEVA